jgi:hypothetical protein
VSRPPIDSYADAPIESVTAVDTDPGRARWNQERGARLGVDHRSWPSLDEALKHGPFDTIISVVALAEQPDLAAALAALIASLRSDGALLVVEPTLWPGAATMLATGLLPLLSRYAPLHVNRDVPSAIRTQGLTLVTIERFTMPTLIWPLRHFVSAVARPITPAPDGESEVGS